MFTTGQERRNKPESSAAKLYCLHLQEQESKRARALLLTSLGAREQESKRERARVQECKRARARALLFTSLGASEQEPEPESKSARAQARERMAETPSPFKENYPSPRTHHSLIGCSPWPSCSHGEGRVHGVEKYPWHMRRLFVYHLEHRMSAPSCNGECEGGSPQVGNYLCSLLRS